MSQPVRKLVKLSEAARQLDMDTRTVKSLAVKGYLRLRQIGTRFWVSQMNSVMGRVCDGCSRVYCFWSTCS